MLVGLVEFCSCVGRVGLEFKETRRTPGEGERLGVCGVKRIEITNYGYISSIFTQTQSLTSLFQFSLRGDMGYWSEVR